MLTALFLFLQQTAATVATAATAAPGPDGGEVKPFLIGSALIVLTQDALKSQATYQKFVAAFPGADKWAHRFVAFSGSLLTGAGIHVVYTGSLLAGGHLSADLPPLADMLANLLHDGSDVGGVFVLQQMLYRLLSARGVTGNGGARA